MSSKIIFIAYLYFNLFFLINSLKIEDIINNLNSKKQNKVKLKEHEESKTDRNDEDLIDISSGYKRINSDDQNYFYIPLFCSSDIHGHFYPEDFDVGEISYKKGGLDYLAKYINIIKEEFKNQFLYLDAGDLFQGGTESTITKGEIMMDYFNLINLNATTFGNHEYDESRDFLEQKVSEAKFPFLATNVYDTIKKTKNVFGENHITSKIFTFKVPNKNGEEEQIKIGVVGLSMNMPQNQISGEGFENIKFLSYKNELVDESNKLRNENGVNAVVLLSHIGIGCGEGNNLNLNMYKPTDEQETCNKGSDLYTLINSIDEGIIDAVVTGHSHREVHHWIRNIPIVSPINYGAYANIIYLPFDRNNNYKFVRDEARIEGPLPICEKIFKQNYKCEFIKEDEMEDYLPLVEYKFHDVKIEKDPILQPVHDKYDEIYNIYNEKICNIIGTEDTMTIATNGSFYVGNLMADIQNVITGSEISIVSYGNLRTTWSPGKLPRYKLQDMLPYGNNICSFTMNGNELKKAMKILQTGRKKYYPTSGLKQIMAKNENEEYYLADIKLFDGYKETEIISDKEYLVSANSYLIEQASDDFYNILTWYKPKNLKCDYGKDVDLTEEYLKKQGTIDVRKYMDPNNPRIRFIE